MHRGIRCAAAALLFALSGTVGATAPASAATSATSSCPLPRYGPGKDYEPQIDPATFTPNVTNPLFPLTPGTTLVYTGTKDGKPTLDLVVPSSHTKVLDGVRTRVVEDRLYLGNRLEERTSDYYAQDACGNVWYFGEDTAELDRHGKVTNTEGSWHAGVGGAQPGVFMQAAPEVGRRFRQEWLAGQAEDTFSVLDAVDTGDRAGRDVQGRAAHQGDDRARTRGRRQQVLRRVASARSRKSRSRARPRSSSSSK